MLIALTVRQMTGLDTGVFLASSSTPQQAPGGELIGSMPLDCFVILDIVF